MIGRDIQRYVSVTSTNDVARECALAGETEGLVITAEVQTAGRGRMGRRWVAPLGSSIQLSVLLRPSIPPSEFHYLTMLAALAIVAALRRKYDLEPALKWPNDVLLNGKKCAGILVETSTAKGAAPFAIIGIGLNGNFAMGEIPELSGIATTLSDELGRKVDLLGIEAEVLAQIDTYYNRVNTGETERVRIFKEWRSILTTLGQPIRVLTSSGIEEGIAEDVEADGALVLRKQDEVTRIYSGDVTLLRT